MLGQQGGHGDDSQRVTFGVERHLSQAAVSYSWNNRSNIFWVDQPPGTGFSKGSYDHDEDGVAEDM